MYMYIRAPPASFVGSGFHGSAAAAGAESWCCQRYGYRGGFHHDAGGRNVPSSVAVWLTPLLFSACCVADPSSVPCCMAVPSSVPCCLADPFSVPCCVAVPSSVPCCVADPCSVPYCVADPCSVSCCVADTCSVPCCVADPCSVPCCVTDHDLGFRALFHPVLFS